MQEKRSPEQKIFWGLFALASAVGICLLLIIWYLAVYGAEGLPGPAVWIVSAIFTALLAGSIGAVLLFSLSLYTGRAGLMPPGTSWAAMNILLPMTMMAGKLLKVDRNRLIRAFINLNNSVAFRNIQRKGLSSAIVLLPHCLQLDTCELKLTNDIYKCIECGRCDIKNLAQLGKNYNMNIRVATGGTMARRLVKEFRPEVIIAVACERDLLSGIKDTYPMPVIGVCNTRPEGPCRNTRVECSEIEDTLRIIKENNTKEGE
ncbi:DUF116 domain-containing protein [Limisalsivibrio acetivorans]|uniref:DUF116 domain-containing protein n=1 Tax=Limisalsivibrio acetivorans TaxID=1304888 RepID=UPI0003B37D8E|nr:DUF116 domain-containing protein [Limisalsivibrio acetivorans]